ncbi:hypothetical protein DCS_05962 [Drechmeria coniospora]|uniref:HD domain-containing protein n=1 Tax=Drechmeria coniospora TaxID=98403 RepID=A0A151GA98_DRECN|nr:hypothetical protein DCS_05962 [Drechmeria coniospora]KYK54012.1 hypothetical protein DCS_05962 [Drechmeria coniospora]
MGSQLDQADASNVELSGFRFRLAAGLFSHILERLKTTKREGWRRFDINRLDILVRPWAATAVPSFAFPPCRGESVSDHMYRMSMICMFPPPSLATRLDMEKCIKMCLVHDMAELLVGDITPIHGVARIMVELTGKSDRNMEWGIPGRIPAHASRCLLFCD